MLKNRSLPFLAFLQTTGLVVYLIFLSLFFNFITPNFANTSTQFFAPIIMLLLFVFSAVISATLVLGLAGKYFWEKQYDKSFTLIGWSVAWGAMYFGLLVLLISFM